MDVRWVSSLSWYFLNFFGLNGLYRLILGNDNCMFRSAASFPLEIRDHSCNFFFRPIVNHHLMSPRQIRLRTFDPSNWRLLTGDFLIAAFLLCCLLCNFPLGPIKNDQRRPNRRKRWQVRSRGRCNRVSLDSQWIITRSFRLSGTTSDLPRGCIIGLVMMLRPEF